MGSHPLNLVFRFVLELCALVAVGMFGWVQFDGALQWGAVVAFPLLFATVWGTFAVPDDPSRKGTAPVAVPGLVRLALELGLFGAATAALHFAEQPPLALGFAAAVILHYGLSYDRIAWLRSA